MELPSNSSRITGSTRARIRVSRSLKICVSSFRVCAMMRRMSVFLPYFALLPCLFHHHYKDVFKRVPLLVGVPHLNAAGFQFVDRLALAGFRVCIGDHMQAVAEE